MLQLDLIQTLAFGGVALLVGYGLRNAVPVFGRYNIPPPVLGGLLVAIVLLISRNFGELPVKFDTTLQSPLMIAFFTTIGFGASLSLLALGRTAGGAVLRSSRLFSRLRRTCWGWASQCCSDWIRCSAC